MDYPIRVKCSLKMPVLWAGLSLLSFALAADSFINPPADDIDINDFRTRERALGALVLEFPWLRSLMGIMLALFGSLMLPMAFRPLSARMLGLDGLLITYDSITVRGYLRTYSIDKNQFTSISILRRSDKIFLQLIDKDRSKRLIDLSHVDAYDPLIIECEKLTLL